MAVAVYVRVSTEEQRERQSIMTQREFADRYCQLHSLAVHRVYADDGVSGTVALQRRPEGSQILGDARLGKFNQLLIYRLDRLGRDTRLILNAVDELEKLGVRVRSMTEEFDTGSATGRLMLTLLSGFASHERDVIRERSVAGTIRVAEMGAWLGGIVPFGYRKQGEKRNARLVISDDAIPGLALSEAGVIREVFRLSAVEKKSCRRIAERLNQLRVPCAYTRDDRLVVSGKRKQATAGIWRPGRIRALLTNKTYMGVHEFGKRSVGGRPVVCRSVPAIVTEAVWKKAQNNLKAHQLFSKRSAKNQYLLRGLIKCGICGLTYIGIAANRPNGKREFYYRCNGAQTPRLRREGKCPAKAVRGDHLEQQIWSDVESFLRNPGAILGQLQAKLVTESKSTDHFKRELAKFEGLLRKKETERKRVVALYRRGRLNDAELDEQMNEIGQEENALRVQADELRLKLNGADSIDLNIDRAGTLLAKLRQRLDKAVSWEQKRQLVEVLIGAIQVDTEEANGVRQTKITVMYRFAPAEGPASLVLAQSYTPDSSIRIPPRPETVGDHIRLRRLRLKLIQKQVAERVGVTEESICNWEANANKPGFEYMPAIIRFLGYNPLPPGANWAERLVRGRMALGWSQKELAAKLRVDPSTLARWERGERDPDGQLATRALTLLASAPPTCADALQRAG